MINPATRPSNQLNIFTQQFTSLGEGWPEAADNFWVKLRNGTLVRPVYNRAEEAFFAEDYRYRWNLDGTSMTRSDYDMMELITI